MRDEFYKTKDQVQADMERVAQTMPGIKKQCVDWHSVRSECYYPHPLGGWFRRYEDPNDEGLKEAIRKAHYPHTGAAPAIAIVAGILVLLAILIFVSWTVLG